MPSAIVLGATGILGREIVFELGRQPQQWPTVHALSRSKKEKCPDNVVHHHIDLTSSAQDMAKDLENVQGEYIFFAAYLQKDTEQENWDVNGAMLKNFLEALTITGAEKHVKRIILTTGAKQYGVHLGVPKNPMEESDSWLHNTPPNFYYNQQNILKEASQGKDWDWVVTYPNDVIGVAKGNFMNLATSIGLYAALTKAMGKEFLFPGSETFYTKFDSFTYSKLHAQFNAWAALEPRCSNQAFNVVNGDVESWQKLWPKLAAKFGLKVPERMFDLEGLGEGAQPLQEEPPLAEFAAQNGLVGRTKQSLVEMKIDLMKWSQTDEVKQAWQTMAKEHNLEEDALEKATWGFLNFVLGRNFDLVISMSKARKLGWTGYIDTWESLDNCLDELAEESVLPKFH